MIEWINKRLVRWGEWMAGCGGRGASGSSYPAYQLVYARGAGGAGMLCDADVMEIDRVMAHVKVTRPELYETAYGRYVQGLSNLTIAGRMRCHVNTVYSRIDSLHTLVENRIPTHPARQAATNA